MRVQTVQLRLLGNVLTGILANSLQATGGAGALRTAHIGLASALPGYSPDMDPAGVIECDFVGYERKPISWGPAGVSSDGRATTHGSAAAFSPDDDTAPGVAVGVAVYDALTAGNLLGVGSFPVPVQMASELDDCTVLLAFSLPSATANDYGSITAIN